LVAAFEAGRGAALGVVFAGVGEVATASGSVAIGVSGELSTAAGFGAAALGAEFCDAGGADSAWAAESLDAEGAESDSATAGAAAGVGRLAGYFGAILGGGT
jgi:hypothetical protein